MDLNEFAFGYANADGVDCLENPEGDKPLTIDEVFDALCSALDVSEEEARYTASEARAEGGGERAEEADDLARRLADLRFDLVLGSFEDGKEGEPCDEFKEVYAQYLEAWGQQARAEYGDIASAASSTRANRI